jgi:BirA family biotin operon repressor/biotin-[acetyl-CoA-carboxylase] ligase
VLLRPAAVPPVWRGWLPLLTGVAVAAGVRAQTGVEASLKWPNDVLAQAVGGSAGKLAGILAEQAADAIVVGIGLNVAASPDLAPAAVAAAGGYGGSSPRTGTSTTALPPVSLADLTGEPVDRVGLLTAILRELEDWYRRWAHGESPGDAAGCGLKAAYLGSCSTLGRDVRVELPGGAVLTGRASDVDDVGRLLVTGPDRAEWVSAGDVIHVR